jgi:hypothetical protein
VIEVKAHISFSGFAQFNSALLVIGVAKKLSCDSNLPLLDFVRPAYTDLPAGVPARYAHIALVFLARNASKIFQAVVSSIPVNVVNKLSIFAVNNSPNNAVSYAINSEDGATLVSVGYGRQGFCACVAGIPSLRNALVFEKVFRALSPKQLPRIRFIPKQLTEQFGCNIGSVSHSAVPLHSGQDRAVLVALLRSALHSRVMVCSQ